MCFLKGIFFQNKPISSILKTCSGLYPFFLDELPEDRKVLFGYILGDWCCLSLQPNTLYFKPFLKTVKLFLTVFKLLGFCAINGLGSCSSVLSDPSPLSDRWYNFLLIADDVTVKNGFLLAVKFPQFQGRFHPDKGLISHHPYVCHFHRNSPLQYSWSLTRSYFCSVWCFRDNIMATTCNIIFTFLEHIRQFCILRSTARSM